jgi:hypothetical protein
VGSEEVLDCLVRATFQGAGGLRDHVPVLGQFEPGEQVVVTDESGQQSVCPTSPQVRVPPVLSRLQGLMQGLVTSDLACSQASLEG